MSLRFPSFALCATEGKPCAAGVAREFRKTNKEKSMQEKKEGAASVGAALEVINRRGSYQQPPRNISKESGREKEKVPLHPL